MQKTMKLDNSLPCITSQQTFARLQHVFRVIIFHLPRCFQDVFKTKNCYAEDVLKKCLEDILKTCLDDVFCLVDKQNVYWVYLYLANLNVYLTSLYFTNLYLMNLRRIQNAIIRT